ncbi:CU044_2847 family protein [Candidatus Thiosymbion oneisti]|uniref:CU044_2847 family protein n=1 Tax=Candidatus Thiosymbion oneisti TaxID=589554 RepID=UPI000B7E178B|nr:CU044_2847 family protein [Candidatus Thiosymbion oneisti]
MSDRELLAFELADGIPVYVETTDTGTDAGLRRVDRGPGDPLKADSRFEEAVGRIRPAAQALLDSLRELNTPEEIGLEFGLKFNAKAGAVIASVDSEATFKVSIKWKNPA